MNRTWIKIFLTIGFVTAGLAWMPQALSEQKSNKNQKQPLHDMVSGAGYGIAGCGLGSIIFGPKPGKIQIISSTSNGIYSNNAFGITSGTSNCDIPAMGQQAAAYLEINKEIVKKEAARGSGETLLGLSHLLKCQNQGLFEKSIHKNYEKIFSPNQTSYGSIREIINTIKNNEQLSASCDIEA